MDNTALFRACARAMKVRKKKQLSCASTVRPLVVCPISTRAKEIVKDATDLRNFLIKNRKDYININHLSSEMGRFSDLDRDRIESDAETAMRSCNQLLKNLKLAAKSDDSCVPHVHSHRQAVVEIVAAYLTAVCRIYSEQRAVRMKKVADMKRLSRLTILFQSSNSPVNRTNTLIDHLQYTDENSCTIRRRHHSYRNSTLSHDDSSKRETGVQDHVVHDSSTEQLTEGERQQLMVENEAFFNKVNLMVDEIGQLEGKMTEMEHLQRVFTDKVLEQEKDIVRVNDVAIHTTENVNTGNEHIRDALKQKASMRLYILFFLLVLTFTLLFLDWYNP